MTEAAAVLAEGRITPQDLGLWKDDHIAGLKRIVEFLHGQGARAGVQLAHAGRKASMARPWAPEQRYLTSREGGWQNVMAPSALRFDDEYAQPIALDLAGIETITEAFTRATERALEAGFDLVELHAAHGCRGLRNICGLRPRAPGSASRWPARQFPRRPLFEQRRAGLRPLSELVYRERKFSRKAPTET